MADMSSSQNQSPNTQSQEQPSGGSRYVKPEVKLNLWNTFLTNAEKIEEIHHLFTRYNHGLGMIRQTQQLHKKTQDLFTLRIREEGEDADALKAYEKLRGDANQRYIDTVDFAREVFDDDPGAQIALQLNGSRDTSKAGWSRQTHALYTNLLANPEYIEKMGVFGYTEESIKEEAAMVQAAIDADAEYERETGESQTVTVERDESFDLLNKTMQRFYKVADKALRDYPQWREKLGMVE
ncbi:MAG: hypothetical protein ACLFSB_16715 [Chitinispirillaceae bacterium]